MRIGDSFTIIIQEISDLDQLEENGLLDETMMGMRNTLKMDLANLCKTDEISWK